MPALILRAVMASVDDPQMRCYALPAAFNFSSEKSVLLALVSEKVYE